MLKVLNLFVLVIGKKIAESFSCLKDGKKSIYRGSYIA